MHNYKISFSREADIDLLDIYTYIYCELKNLPGAEKTIAKILKRCKELATFPKQGSVRIVVDYEELRFIHSGKYVIIYCVDDTTKTVLIRAIKHSRMDLKVVLNNSSG